jgi:hypothetical protein
MTQSTEHSLRTGKNVLHTYQLFVSGLVKVNIFVMEDISSYIYIAFSLFTTKRPEVAHSQEDHYTNLPLQYP